MTFSPLFILALVFLAFAIFDWNRLPICARASLAAATAFVLGGLHYPGAGLEEIVEAHRDGVAYLVDLARAVGFASMLTSMTFLVRGALER
jgi:hypothetical protein